MKTCYKCKEQKTPSEFSKDSAKKDKLAIWCRKCKNDLCRVNRKFYELRQYGLTPNQYDAMFKEQNGACFICKGQDLSGCRLSVDHDHKTSKVRGLLCGNCNTGLGSFKDNVGLLILASEYLERNGSKVSV